jgi:hypothetical protein
LTKYKKQEGGIRMKRAILAVTALGMAAFLIAMAPDIKRYWKITSM